MKFIIILMAMFIPLISLSQQQYPVKTIFRNDSVIMMSVGEAERINRLVEDQKTEIRSLEIELSKETKRNNYLDDKISNLVDSINLKSTELSLLYDSLKNSNKNFKNQSDSLKGEITSIKQWLVNSAIANSFIYIDWDTYSIKTIDLNLYTSRFNFWGKFKFIPIEMDYRKHIIQRIEGKKQPFEGNWVNKFLDFKKPNITICPIKIDNIAWQE